MVESDANMGLDDRIKGILLMLVGAVSAYLCVIMPLIRAQQGEPSFTLSQNGAVIVPLAVGYGLARLILGEQAGVVLGTRGRRTPVFYILIFALVILGLALYIWLKSQLESLGYVVTRPGIP